MTIFSGVVKEWLNFSRVTALLILLFPFSPPVLHSQEALFDQGKIPDADSGFARALDVPEALKENSVDPARGFQFGVGYNRFKVSSRNPAFETDPGPPFSLGGSFSMDWVWRDIRIGYLRYIFRGTPSEGTLYKEAEIYQLGFDVDQLWAYYGFRPWYHLYLGYGLGYQRRVAFFKYLDKKKSETEFSPLHGLIIDYAFAPPLSFQVRKWIENSEQTFSIEGETYHLSYIVPF